MPKCKICGEDREWVDCDMCDEGYFDGYDEDPLWYDPGDLVPCSQCNGAGGWSICPNQEEHFKQQIQEQNNSRLAAEQATAGELKG